MLDHDLIVLGKSGAGINKPLERARRRSCGDEDHWSPNRTFPA